MDFGSSEWLAKNLPSLTYEERVAWFMGYVKDQSTAPFDKHHDLRLIYAAATKALRHRVSALMVIMGDVAAHELVHLDKKELRRGTSRGRNSLILVRDRVHSFFPNIDGWAQSYLDASKIYYTEQERFLKHARTVQGEFRFALSRANTLRGYKKANDDYTSKLYKFTPKLP